MHAYGYTSVHACKHESQPSCMYLNTKPSGLYTASWVYTPALHLNSLLHRVIVIVVVISYFSQSILILYNYYSEIIKYLNAFCYFSLPVYDRVEVIQAW